MTKMPDLRSHVIFELGNSIKYIGPVPKTSVEALAKSLAVWFKRYEFHKDRPAMTLYQSMTDYELCGLCDLYFYFDDEDVPHCDKDETLCPIAQDGHLFCHDSNYTRYCENKNAETALAEYRYLVKLARKYCPDVKWVDWHDSECTYPVPVEA